MAGELPHIRGKIGLAGVGWLAELESFDVSFEGDPIDLEAIEGTVGQLEPKGKRIEISGVLFVPTTSHAQSKITTYWNSFTRVEMVAEWGNMFVSAKGRFNAPKVSDDGTKLSFTFRGASPKIRALA